MKPDRVPTNVYRAVVFALASLSATALWAHESRPDPGQLMRDVIENELTAEAADHSSWRYVERRDDEKKSEVRDIVLTPDGFVYRTLAVNGEMPNADAECRRIRKVLSDPAELQHTWEAQQHDAEKLRNLMRMLPDAFFYRYDEEPLPQEPLPAGRVRMSFTANPDFHPTTTAAEVFRHLEGYVVVDAQTKRLVEINARLISSAKFGGGILGHLDRGGTVVFRQEDVADGHWQPVFVDVNMHGRLLLLSLSLHQRFSNSEYEQLPENIAPKQILNLMINDSNAENAELR